jgi:hypothetical protein
MPALGVGDGHLPPGSGSLFAVVAERQHLTPEIEQRVGDPCVFHYCGGLAQRRSFPERPRVHPAGGARSSQGRRGPIQIDAERGQRRPQFPVGGPAAFIAHSPGVDE